MSRYLCELSDSHTQESRDFIACDVVDTAGLRPRVMAKGILQSDAQLIVDALNDVLAIKEHGRKTLQLISGNPEE